ncbi:protein PAF1 homolog isoform X2 [Solanum lycopersicum]|uniref:protein PAF1 homolog isoform X2 n=1 Tax=Solanum lycopersicum TaxID=4081 RepID=UPI0008FED16F|nr:uncharacterized protein LOC109119895 isoform X2 [Solanum lycopersicum]
MFLGVKFLQVSTTSKNTTISKQKVFCRILTSSSFPPPHNNLPMSQFRQTWGYRVNEGSPYSYQFIPPPPLSRHPYLPPPPPDSLYPQPPPPPPSPTPCPPPPSRPPPSSFTQPSQPLFSPLVNRYPSSSPPPPSEPRFRLLPPHPPSQTVGFKQTAPLPVKNSNETREERRLRKKKEFEKVRQKQRIREAQNRIVEKTKLIFFGRKGHGSIRSDRNIAPLPSGGMTGNLLKKQQLKSFSSRNKSRELGEGINIPTICQHKEDFSSHCSQSMDLAWPLVYLNRRT